VRVLTGRGRRRATAIVSVATALTILVPSTAAAKGGADEFRSVGRRTTDGDVNLRVYKGEFDRPVLFAGTRRVPRSCFPDVDLLVGVSTPRVAASTESIWHSSGNGERVPRVDIVGSREGAPIGVVTMRAPRGADRASARFVGGTHDEAGVMKGWIVLAGRLPATYRGPDVVVGSRTAKVKVYDAEGSVIATEWARHDYGDWAAIGRPECATDGEQLTPVPVGLPEPTGPPPTDETSARAAVVATYENAYGARGNADAALQLIQDGDTEAVRTAQQTAAERNQQYRDRITAVVREVRFLNDREAAVRFDLKVDGTEPLLTGYIGRAVLVGDTWKVARSSYCELLAVGGTDC
jgi:hypothetical protein